MILKNVIKINKVIFKDCDYIILKQIGKVLCYNSDENKIMFEIIVGLKVNDIFENLFETEECVYEFDLEKNEVKKTNFVNFYHYFSSIQKLLRVYKTIDVNIEENNGQEVKYLTTKEIQLNPEYNPQTNENILIFRDKNVFDRKFNNSFQLIGDRIGEGSFGVVFRVKERKNQDLFAIKTIEMRGDINFLTLFQLIISVLQINGNTI